jgi:signal transduction histidine kinase
LALDQLREPSAGPADVLCRYRPDESRWLRVEITHIPVARKSAVLLRVRDVSEEQRSQDERRRLERRMLESRRLESLGELAGGIAHDFNNLLTVILGNAKLVAAELPQGSEAELQLGHISSASLHAAGLVKQMLIYAGRSPAVSVPIDVSQLVAEARPPLAGSLANGVRLTLDLAPELPAVHGDPRLLHQTIVNLVENAGEAVEDVDGDGGQVKVSTRAVRLTDEDLAGAVIGGDLRPGERLLIEVSDNGHGIDEDSAGRIFEPFFSTKFTGRGLGLAVVLGVLRQHRGVLAFESAPGAGTTFRIWLPTRDLTEPAQH